MPYVNDNYVQLTEQQILDELRGYIETESNGTFKSEGTGVIPAILSAIAAEVANNQEQAIADTYAAAYAATANGETLEDILAITGKERLSSTFATGSVRFAKSFNTDATVNIPQGTTVQTTGSDPQQFTTNEAATLETWEDFEAADLSAYTGDTGNFSLDNSVAYQGTQSLTHDATAEASIYRDDLSFGPGDTISFKYRDDLSGTNEFSILFGGTDADNCYEGRFFTGSPVFGIWAQDGGTRTTNFVGSIGSNAPSFDVYDNTWITITIEWELDNRFRVSLYDNTGTLIEQDTGGTTIPGDNVSYGRGGIGFGTAESNGAGNTGNLDLLNLNGQEIKVTASTAGESGNVGEGTITSMPSPVSGVSSVVNRYATGNPSEEFEDGEPFTPGDDDESDAELLERAQTFTSVGGATTYDGIIAGVLDAGARSANIEFNNTGTDNTGSGGLPPYSFEVIAFGGADYDVGKAIYDRITPTQTFTGGTYGTNTDVDIEAINGQEFTISFSRPQRNSIVGVEFDLVVTEDYAGDDAVLDAALAYIGGDTVDNVRIFGLDPGEDVVINDLFNAVTAVEGVVGIDTTGPNSGFSEATTIRSDGLEVIAIDTNKVAYFERSSFDGVNTTTSAE